MQKKFSTPSSVPGQRASEPRQARPITRVIYEREPRFSNKTHPAQYVIFAAVGLCLLLALLRTLSTGSGEPAQQTEEPQGDAAAPAAVAGNGSPLYTEWQAQIETPAPDVPKEQAEKVKPEPKALTPDPEQDLFGEGTPIPAPKDLADDVKKADQLLEKGRLLLKEWRETSSAKAIKDAKNVLEQAVEAYRLADKQYTPHRPYIRSQLTLAKRLQYTAMKCSPM